MRWSLSVTMTARVRRPFVASTSFAEPFTVSMSRFTGSESRATMATIWWASTTLPWPTLTSRGAAPFGVRLLKILHLLANLLEHALGGQRRLAELEIVGLRADGVHLAVELLDQEVERASHRPALVESQAEFGQMRAQPRELFGHVALLGPDRRLGQDARLVDRGIGEQPAQALAQSLLATR